MFGSKRRRVIEAQANLAVKRENAALVKDDYIRVLENAVEKGNDAISAQQNLIEKGDTLIRVLKNRIAAQDELIAILKKNVPPTVLAAAEQELKRLNAAQIPH